MQRSKERILTTHAGSLPKPAELQALYARQFGGGETVDESTLAAAATEAAPVLLEQQTSPAPAVAFEYSDGYRTRAKIHKIASVATLPLFGAEAFLG